MCIDLLRKVLEIFKRDAGAKQSQLYLYNWDYHMEQETFLSAARCKIRLEVHSGTGEYRIAP